jgi:hypothetical protein
MVSVFPRSDDPGVFIEGEGDLGLVGETGPFEDDLGTEFGHGKPPALSMDPAR